MKLTLLFITVFFTFQISFSQKKNIDSLDLVLSNIKNDSLLKVKFDDLIYTYRNTKPKLHLYLIKKALLISEQTKDSSRKAYITRELGIYYRKKGDLDSAIYFYNKSLLIHKKKKDSIGIYSVKSSLGNAYKAKGNFDESIKNFNETIDFFSKQGKIGEKRVLMAKNNLGGLYVAMKDWKTADLYFEEVYKHPLIKKNKRFLNMVSNNLVITKTQLDLFDEAISYALIVEKNEKRPRSLANLFINIGNLYEKKREFILANDYYKKSLEKYKSIHSSEGIMKSYNNLGNNFRKWKKYEKAEYFLLKSNKLLIDDDNLNSLQTNYEMLSDLYFEKKEYKKSLDFMKKGSQIKDSILNKDKINSIVKYETLYKTEKSIREKEKAIAEGAIAKLENKKNKNLLISALLILILLLFSALFYFDKYKVKKKNELILIELKEMQKRLALEKQYQLSELKALKAQMDPHFIFNALNSIQEYIVLNQKDLASDYLGKFADLMRKYLNYSDRGSISLQEEIETLNMYLELEKIRFEDSLTYQINIEINNKDVEIPTMLIQPYVENALKHGLLHRQEDRKLSIFFLKNKNNIQCIIEDNGIGREKSKKLQLKKSKPHKSFASKATQERLELLNFGKDKKIGVEIIDLYDGKKNAIGTKVILVIPILNN